MNTVTAVVADTHAIVWYLEDSKRLSAPALSAMRSAIEHGEVIYVSPVSMVEIAYLTEKRRLPKNLFDRLAQLLRQEHSGLIEAPFHLGMAETLRTIPTQLIPEMPDRMIAATAMYLKLPLITCDHKIQATPLITIW